MSLNGSWGEMFSGNFPSRCRAVGTDDPDGPAHAFPGRMQETKSHPIGPEGAVRLAQGPEAEPPLRVAGDFHAPGEIVFVLLMDLGIDGPEGVLPGLHLENPTPWGEWCANRAPARRGRYGAGFPFLRTGRGGYLALLQEQGDGPALREVE